MLLMWYGSNPLHVRRHAGGLSRRHLPFSALRLGSRPQGHRAPAGDQTLTQLETEVKQLRVVNRDLSATNQTLRGLEAENNRLRNALGYRERANFQLMPARIIARDASTWYNTVTIDRGTRGAHRARSAGAHRGRAGGQDDHHHVAEHTCVIVLDLG